MSGAFALGFGLGLLVAAQLGPLSLLLIRSTLRGGVAVGLAIGAFGTSLAATASNPLTIASWAAVFAAASTAGAADTLPAAAALLVGVGLGSLTWVSALACGVAAGRRFVGDRLLRAVDVIAGAGLVGFGSLLAFRTFVEE